MLLAERQAVHTITDDRGPFTPHTGGSHLAAMEFRVDCTCGAHFMVREGLAGTRRTCSCGRLITVPPLHELRRQVGLMPYEISPELVIEHMLAANELPADHACVRCRLETDQVLHVEVECERRQIRDSGDHSWGLVLASLVFRPLLLLLLSRQRGEQKEYGKDKIYTLPLVVCPGCRRTLQHQGAIKEALGQVPEYRRLLNKFLDAKVRLVSLPY
jgi:hypothetical protein